MKSVIMRITLITTLLFMLFISSVYAAPEQRTALVIGNGGYSSSPLKNPVNDATALAAQLQKLGFAVILKKNANLRGMEDALTEFGDRLKRGGVGLFFYAGHGLQVGGVNYLVPVGAKVNRESDIKYETLDAGKVLDEMANANNGLNIVILDACRDNPYSRSFRNAARGLAVVSNAPVGTFISYSTGPGNVARDGDGQNSPYTEALLRHMKEPGLSIEQVFKGVRTKLGKDTGGKQIPWELSSLQGDFFFVPGSTGMATQPKRTDIQPEDPPVVESAPDELDLAMAKIQQKKDTETAQKEQIEGKFRALLADVKKYKIIIKENVDAETKAAAWRGLTRKYPLWSVGVETGQADGIVLKAIDEDTEGNFKKIAGDEGFLSIIANKEVVQRRIAEGKKQLETEREAQRRFEEAKKHTIARYPGKKILKEGDSRFIAFHDGTVLDTKTNLMWASKDNGRNIDWAIAKSYSENYRGGGYTDWRMPTQDELAGLYDGAVTGKNGFQLTNLIELTACCPWASETRSLGGFFSGFEAAYFHFSSGTRYWLPQSYVYSDLRALPVRSVK